MVNPPTSTKVSLLYLDLENFLKNKPFDSVFDDKIFWTPEHAIIVQLNLKVLYKLLSPWHWFKKITARFLIHSNYRLRKRWNMT